MFDFARRWLAAGWLLVAAVALVVLLVVRAGDDGEDDRARVGSERPRAMSICNVSLHSVSDQVVVEAFPDVLDPDRPRLITLTIPIPNRLELYPDAGLTEPIESLVALNAETGEVVVEHYRTREEKVELQRVLSKMVVGPPDSDAWPRVDREPEHIRARLAGNIAYRPPDPRSGLLVSFSAAEEPSVLVSTCDSSVAISAETGEVLASDVHQEEEAMFERFLSEVLGLQQASMP